MDNDDSDLRLRRHSVRTLTPAELGAAHGGRPNNPPTSGPADRTIPPTRTK